MFDVFDLLNGARITPTYVKRALSQGVHAIHVTVNNFSTIRPYPTLEEAVQELGAIRQHYASLGDAVHIVEKFADLESARRDGKLAIVLGYQNVPGIGTNLKMLEVFHAAGVRVIQISHNNRGLYADGCAETSDAGLSGIGKELVHELNRLGIVIDLSHTGSRSTIETIEHSRHPVAVTHANAFSVCQNRRNKTDDVLDALKAKDGVIGICYLTPLVREGSQALGHADVLQHVTYIRDRIGTRHLGIGSDFIDDQPAERYQEFMRRPDLYGTWPWIFPVKGLEDQQRFLESLGDAGFTRSEIADFASANFLRLFKSVLQ